MDSAKSAIKSLVLDLRKTLESEIEVQLRRYGISAGKWRDVSELKHLDDHGVACRIRIEEAIRHEMHHGGDKTDEAARAARRLPAWRTSAMKPRPSMSSVRLG